MKIVVVAVVFSGGVVLDGGMVCKWECYKKTAAATAAVFYIYFGVNLSCNNVTLYNNSSHKHLDPMEV